MPVSHPKDRLNYPPMIIVYGPAGCGKTALVSQAANGYAYDFDNGMRTAATLVDQYTEQRQRLSIICDDKQNNPLIDGAKITAWKNFKDDLTSVQLACQRKTFKYNAIIIDSHTVMCDCIRRYVIDLAGNPTRLEQQHWGIMRKELDNVMVMLRGLNLPIIMTAHPSMLNDETTDKHLLPLTITKNAAATFPAYFDEVWYMRCTPKAQGKVEYTITGKTFGIAYARTRSTIQNVNVDEKGLVGLLDMMGYKLDVDKRA
jgi:archaellum biogenesis ATPase FlaH